MLPSCSPDDKTRQVLSAEDASIDLFVAYSNKGSGHHGGHSLRGISYLGQTIQIS